MLRGLPVSRRYSTHAEVSTRTGTPGRGARHHASAEVALPHRTLEGKRLGGAELGSDEATQREIHRLFSLRVPYTRIAVSMTSSSSSMTRGGSTGCDVRGWRAVEREELR